MKMHFGVFLYLGIDCLDFKRDQAESQLSAPARPKLGTRLRAGLLSRGYHSNFLLEAQESFKRRIIFAVMDCFVFPIAAQGSFLSRASLPGRFSTLKKSEVSL